MAKCQRHHLTGPKRDRSGNPIGAAAGAGAGGGGGGAGYGAAAGAIPTPMYKDDYDVSDSDTKTQILEGFSDASTVILNEEAAALERADTVLLDDALLERADTVLLEDAKLERADTEILDATRKEQRFRAAFEAYQRDFKQRADEKEKEDKQKEEETQQRILSQQEKEQLHKQQELFIEKQSDTGIMTSMGLSLKKPRIVRHHKPETAKEKDVSAYIADLLGGSKDLAALALSGVTPMYKWTRREAKDYQMHWSNDPALSDIQFTPSHYYFYDLTPDTMLIDYGTIESALKTDEDGEHTVTVKYPVANLWETAVNENKIMAMNSDGNELFVVANRDQMYFDIGDAGHDESISVIGMLCRIKLDGNNSQVEVIHRINMEKRMFYESGYAAVHPSGKMFALVYIPWTNDDDRDYKKDLVISVYDEETKTWYHIVHRLPDTRFEMMFAEKSGDLIGIGYCHHSKVNLTIFTQASRYRDKKQVSGKVEGRDDLTLFSRCEHNGILFFSDEENDREQGTTIYSMETATGKIIPALTLEPSICSEKIVMINDSLMGVVYNRCRDDDDEPAMYYRTYRPETLHLYGAHTNKK